MILKVLPRSSRAAVTYAAVLIAISDWRVEINATLAFLYIFPMLLLGTVSSPLLTMKQYALSLTNGRVEVGTSNVATNCF